MIGFFPVSIIGFTLSLAAVFAVAVVTTFLSLRLLGVGRGWTSALLSGVIGWSLAALIALGLADWDWSADEVAARTLVIGIPATMAVAVLFDLVARPGSLATGERAGMVVPPRPVKAIRGRIAVLRRYRELMGLFRREGFGPLQSSRQRRVRTVDPLGVRLRRVLEEAGGVYIKLGQIAATRVDMFPPDVCNELAKLQNRVASEPVENIRPVLVAELNGQVEDVFATFDWEPLAAASIAQTYRARLHTGEEVVVKVQRPAIPGVMKRDLAALALVAGVAQRRTIFGHGVRSGEMLDQFAANLRDELDFRKEADSMAEMAAALGPDSAVRIPKVYTELCTRRLLVQEHFEGSTVADAKRGGDSVADWPVLADKLLRSSLEQVLRAGLFHADPHPGNVFILADGTLGLIDFGAVGRLDSIQQAGVIDMLIAMGRRDVSLLREGIQRMADVGEAVDPERLERSLARLLANQMRAAGTVQPTVMEELVRLLTEFGIRLPADVVLLSRALVTLDGTLRVMSPSVNLITAATEIMVSADDSILDRNAMIRDEIVAALPHLRHLPDRVDRILTLAGRGELRLRSVVDEDSRRILRTLVNRALLTGIGSAFLLVSAVLLVATDAGPAVASGTGLFDVFGYGGLLVGTVLLLRVVAAVARDGTS